MIRTGEEREKETEEIFETIMTENFPKLITDTKTTGPGSSENTKRINAKTITERKTIPRNIIFKMQRQRKSKIKGEKNPERSQRERCLSYLLRDKGTKIIIISNVFRNMQARRKWKEIFSV